MSKYSDDIRLMAVKRMKETSMSQTAKEMNISKQTLRRWKQISLAPNQQSEPFSKDDDMTDKEELESLPVTHEQPDTSGMDEKMFAELGKVRRLKQASDATIDYLMAENSRLRQQCEKYLRVISLLVQ